jgi:hypothetical protein
MRHQKNKLRTDNYVSQVVVPASLENPIMLLRVNFTRYQKQILTIKTKKCRILQLGFCTVREQAAKRMVK